MKSLTSNSLRMMERSMEYLWVKQAAHQDNIANAETPGYKVKTVTFEEAFDLRLRAVGRHRKGQWTKNQMRKVIEETPWQVMDDQETTRMDDNGVNVTEQSLEMVRTAYQMQYVLRTISSDLTTLGRAISG